MTIGQIQNILKNLPHEPGVYRFYGMADNLLYIGKAKNLKNRVSSYFQTSRHEDNIRLQNMVSQIERVDYTVVKNEKESLILEANLIHNLQPKYNIQLKDDKSYLYVRISNQGDWSNITLTRRRYDKKSQYFGPYTKKYGISNLLRVLRIIFPYCDKSAIDGKPCYYVQLKQCDGICCARESLEDYQVKIDQISKVLSGQTREVETWLKGKMLEAIEINNFELAGLWRDRVKLLDEVVSDQKIILLQEQDLDIVTILIKVDSKKQSENNLENEETINSNNLTVAAAFVQNIRAGKMINLSNFILSGQDYFETDNSRLVQRFLIDYYANKSESVEILLNVWEDK
jgi:excinuclease ABC subunit C